MVPPRKTRSLNFLRSLLFVVWLYAAMVGVGLAFLPACAISRKLSAGAMRAWGRAIVWGMRVILGIRLEIRGREHLPAGQIILAAKHQSMFETVAIFLVLDDPAIVFKKELLWMPVFGWYCWRTGQLLVDREAHAGALKSLIRRAKAVASDGRSIVIFPEGTRRAPDAPPAYKPGVAGLYRQLGLPVVPMALNSGVCWPAHGIRRYRGTIILEFLPLIPTGLKSGPFMAALEEATETATARLVAEARALANGHAHSATGNHAPRPPSVNSG